MATEKRNILVTAALPYANGPIHLGHLVEYIQTDIWVRFHKMRERNCFYICASDCHGTPIMLRAHNENIPPETLVAETHQQHTQDFKDFLIDFDNFYTTHSEENRELVEIIYDRLQKNGDISTEEIEQAYDEEKQMFLPDRFVRGTCPHCGAKNQNGDNCEACGSTYSPSDLKDPISVISGKTPINKISTHYFFNLQNYTEALKKWLNSDHLQEQAAHKLAEWFEQGLKPWDISRDAPYFGFKIPNTEEKYFYVWMDAPIGYMASFKNFCERKSSIDFDAYWGENSTAELYHFIGKDIMYFHSLFWPAVLMASHFRTPSAIFVHGFLTIDGQKMSKSRGTFIKARTYLNHLEPEYLRYYFATKLSPKIEDIDLNLEDFRLRVNSDLVGKVINIASRCAKFINQYFDNQLSAELDEEILLNTFTSAGHEIAEFYEQREYSQAIRKIMALADSANQYIDSEKPWQIIKTDPHSAQVQKICSLGLNFFRLLVLYLKPVLPKLALEAESFLNIEPLKWSDHETLLLNHKIETFQPLMQRINSADIEAIIDEEKQS